MQCTVASEIAVFDETRVHWLGTQFRDFDCTTTAMVIKTFGPFLES